MISETLRPLCRIRLGDLRTAPFYFSEYTHRRLGELYRYHEILLEPGHPMIAGPSSIAMSMSADNLWYRRNMSPRHEREPVHLHPRTWGFLAFAGVLSIIFVLGAGTVHAQETTEAPSEEIVVNFATGRVIVAVVKDAIIIATVENPIEPQTHPPIPMQLNARRVGILLGAVDWFSPSSQIQLARLDRELPHLRSQFASPVPGARAIPNQPLAQAEATDLESVGQGVLESLNRVASNLHAKVSWPPTDPIAQLILAGYVENYGPEVWQLSFPLVQEMRKLDYYDTRITRPVYLQFWPPEKDQIHTLLEFQYPPENKSPTLLELLHAKDPRLEKICASDPKMREVADRFLQGDYKKILAVDATQFLRAVISATTDPKFRQTLAVIGFESGFEWVLRPPAEPKSVAPPQQAEKDRPEGAPSLLGPPSQ